VEKKEEEMIKLQDIPNTKTPHTTLNEQAKKHLYTLYDKASVLAFECEKLADKPSARRETSVKFWEVMDEIKRIKT